MQKIIEFKTKKFWTSTIDVKELNEQLAQYNADGWRATSLIVNMYGLWGSLSYTILLEKPD